MKHVLVCRLGINDNVAIDVDHNEQFTEIDFISVNGDLGHGVGRAIVELRRMGLYPSEVGIELFLLAALVYMADTRLSRRTESQDNWTREIRLVLPVHDPVMWNGCAITIQELLCFLTGDKWLLTFRGRFDKKQELSVTAPQPRPELTFTGLSLFSGGMDSLIGSIDELEHGAQPLFVSHAGDGATSQAQEKCLQGLRAHYPKVEFDQLRIWLQVKKGLVEGVRGENTTRSRSFLFIAAAMMAGSGMEAPFTLRVPENGLIALNVPLDPNRVGALSTRTTHPYYLARWQDVMNHVGIPSTIRNPYWDMTKGEMMEQCKNAGLLLSLLPSSMSCSSPSKARWQGLGTQHCGYCLPCIIRRAAIARGLGASLIDPTPYTLGSLNSVLSTRKSVGKQARSFQVAINRLKLNPKLSEVLILKTGPLSDVADSRQALAGVYLRGMMEVSNVLDTVVTTPV